MQLRLEKSRLMKFRLTKRETVIAAAAAGITGAALAFAQAVVPGVIGASVYSWDAMQMSRTPVGEFRQVLKGPTATLEELEVHITTLNAGASSHPPHHHPNEELVLLDKGIVETLSNGKWERLGPGSVIFNGSESWHSLRNVGDGPAQYFVVNWRSPATDVIAARNGQAK